MPGRATRIQETGRRYAGTISAAAPVDRSSFRRSTTADKTFFFSNFEMFRDRENKLNGLGTVPTDALRNGDFSVNSYQRVSLGVDPLGRPIMENQIYDPATQRHREWTVVAILPEQHHPERTGLTRSRRMSRNLVPATTTADLVNQFRTAGIRSGKSRASRASRSITISTIRTRWRLLLAQRTDKDNGQDDGLPDPISPRRDQLIRSHTVRVNYD